MFEILAKLNPQKAVGSDSISLHVQKSCAMALTDTPCELFSSSLNSKSFPSEWKNHMIG